MCQGHASDEDDYIETVVSLCYLGVAGCGVQSMVMQGVAQVLYSLAWVTDDAADSLYAGAGSKLLGELTLLHMCCQSFNRACPYLSHVLLSKVFIKGAFQYSGGLLVGQLLLAEPLVA